MLAVELSEEREIRLSERPRPEAGPDEVLLAVELCGICGSDLHAPQLTGHFPGGFVLGHEFSGRIVEVGDEVTTWQTGERVVVNPNGNLCGHCDACRQGRANQCPTATMAAAIGVHRDGGMAEYAAVPAMTLHRVPDGLDSGRAAWAETLATAVRAVRGSGVSVGDPALVTGGGPVGLLVVQLLRLAGASPVHVVEPSAFRREIALGCGADRAFDGDEAAAAVQRGEIAPTSVFECSGSAAALDLGLRAVRDRGEIVLVGIPPRPASIELLELIAREIRVRGSYIYVDEFPIALRLLAEGRIDVDALTSAVLPLSEVQDALEGMRRQQVTKVLLRPGDAHTDLAAAAAAP